jgi:hypothetical protein
LSRAVKTEEHEEPQSVISTLHNQPVEASAQIDLTNILPLSPLLTKSKENDRRTETSTEPDNQRESKRRRIDQTDHTTAPVDLGGDAGESIDISMQGVVDIASAGLPGWQVKVEATPTDDERDKRDDGDNIDELRDDEIRRVSKELVRPPAQRLGPAPPFRGPSGPSTLMVTHPSLPTSLTVHAGHLQYAYQEADDRLVCIICA